MNINLDIANKVLTAVDAGLVKGVGNPVPGQMCVEAAVCYALGLPHGDDPQCVSHALRSLKITVNDANWSSNEARAKGLRRLALAQLGSRDILDDKVFAEKAARLAITLSVPFALRIAADKHPDPVHSAALRLAADNCEREGTKESTHAAHAAANSAAHTAAHAAAHSAAHTAAYAATRAAAYAADAADVADVARATYAALAAARATRAATCAARDKHLSDFAEGVVTILIEMKAPGVQWLHLTEGE